RKKSKKTEEKAETATEEVPPKPEGLRSFHVYVGGEYFKVEVGEEGAGLRGAGPHAARVLASAKSAPATSASPTAQPDTKEPSVASVGEGETAVRAPMPGVIVKYEKKVGDRVKSGDPVVIIEAMKMHNSIEAPCDGEIVQIPFEPGASVAKENILCVIKS
ncbi:MAG: biotin/lipoyl-containing protein, partial [Candidatus Hermodarchaeota archaeon]|nr:biotin/lipoyl-containing protein [Candidatus Hermodarchaeota archaeon]